jgi:hypothetical protein
MDRQTAIQQRQVYADALAAEDLHKKQSVRILSGEQYAAEDALSVLRDSLGPNADLEALRKKATVLQGQFSWFDDVNKFISEIDTETQRRKDAAAVTYVSPSEGGP